MTPTRLAAAVALCLGLAPARAADAPKPPAARADPVTDTYFGVAVVDPYRWMEARPEPEFRGWLEKQDSYTRAVLAGLPGREQLGRDVSAVTGLTTSVHDVTLVGDKVVYLKRPPEADIARMYIRDLSSGQETLLVDPAKLGTNGKHAEIDQFAVSQDAGRIVYGVSEGGSENSVLHVIETATGAILPDVIDRAQFAAASWAPDGGSFFYTRLPKPVPGQPATEDYAHMRVLRHVLGADPEADALVLDGDRLPYAFASEAVFPGVSITPGSDVALAFVADGVSPEQAIYAAPVTSLLGGGPIAWKKVADQSDAVVGAAVHGHEAFLLTHKDSPRLKIVAEDLGAPDAATARAVVAQPDAGVLTGLATAADALYVVQRDGSVMHVSRLPYEGGPAEPVALPFEGTVNPAGSDAGDLVSDPRAPGVLVGLESWLRAPVLLRYDPAARSLTDTGVTPPFPRDLSAYEAVETSATAPDGTAIPLSIIARRGTALDGTHPTLLDGYGSYGISYDAEFNPSIAPWLDRGGVFAVAHVRGGGELGQAWHDAGKIATKQNTIADFVACARELVKRGYATSATLAGEGTSAGGITIGGAITQQPALFRAALIRVGSSNASRAELTAGGPANIPEFGTMTDKDQAGPLLAMDAYQHVKDGVDYPAVMVTGGFDDPRVTVWEPAKMAARLQAATASGRPVLLRIEFDAGHGIGSTRAQRDAELADEFAFLLWQFGQR